MLTSTKKFYEDFGRKGFLVNTIKFEQLSKVFGPVAMKLNKKLN